MSWFLPVLNNLIKNNVSDDLKEGLTILTEKIFIEIEKKFSLSQAPFNLNIKTHILYQVFQRITKEKGLITDFNQYYNIIIGAILVSFKINSENTGINFFEKFKFFADGKTLGIRSNVQNINQFLKQIELRHLNILNYELSPKPEILSMILNIYADSTTKLSFYRETKEYQVDAIDGYNGMFKKNNLDKIVIKQVVSNRNSNSEMDNTTCITCFSFF